MSRDGQGEMDLWNATDRRNFLLRSFHPPDNSSQTRLLLHLIDLSRDH